MTFERFGIRRLAAVLGLCMASLAPAGSAFAHHSFAMFDNAKEVTLTGVVKEFQWTNPHTWVQLMVKDSSGKEIEWSIEGGSPNGLARQGWTRKALKPGDKAEVVIHPLKNGDQGGSLVRATVDGQKIGNPSPRPSGG